MALRSKRLWRGGRISAVFRLLYGTGMRKMECLRLRVKDLDFDRRLIVIREAKGNKDRVTLLPGALEGDLRRQPDHARSLWKMDLCTHVLNRGTGVLSPLDDGFAASAARDPPMKGLVERPRLR